MRRLRAFRPDCLGLEERVVLSVSAATAASASTLAGEPASNQVALSAFGQEVQQGLTPTLTVDFGTPTASGPAGTVVMPVAAYAASLGYGWLSNLDTIQMQNDAVAGKNGAFEIDVPPGTYDVTITPAASSSLTTYSEVTAFAAGNQLGGPGGFFEDPSFQSVTLRTTVFKSGASNGLIIALYQGFAIQSVQITPVKVTGAIGLFTPTQPAPGAGPALRVSRAHGHLSISGSAQSSVSVPESGTMIWDLKTNQPDADSIDFSTANAMLNWDLQFPQTPEYSNPNTASRAPVTGVIEAISGPTEVGTGGTFLINTPHGRLKLGVKYSTNTALPFDDLSSPVPLTYTIRGGTGEFRNAKGSGVVDMGLTLTDQSVEGTVTDGVFNPAVAEGTVTLTFQPSTK